MKKSKKPAGMIVLAGLSLLWSPALGETYLEAAKPFYLEPCPASRISDPYPLPETMRAGSDTRPTCLKVLVKEKPSKVIKRDRPKKDNEIRIYQK